MSNFESNVKEALHNNKTVINTSEYSRIVTETPTHYNNHKGTMFLTDFVLPKDAMSESYICSTPNFVDDQMTCILNDLQRYFKYLHIASSAYHRIITTDWHTKGRANRH